MNRVIICIAATVLGWLLAGASEAQTAPTPQFSAQPWLEDLDQLKAELNSHYSHIEWAVHERGADLPFVWATAQGRLRQVRNEAEAREVFDRFLAYFGDGHLKMAWTSSVAVSARSGLNSSSVADCAQLGFRARPDTTAVLLHAEGYSPLVTPDQTIFPAGTITGRGGEKTGVLRIQGFDARLSDVVCARALSAATLAAGAPCDEDCRSRVSAEAWKAYHDAFVSQVKALVREKPTMLVIDLAGNGGGTEWARTAASTLTSTRLEFSTGGMVRHSHSANRLDRLATALGKVEPDTPLQAQELERILAAVARAREEIAQPCDVEPLWRGETISCSPVVRTAEIYPRSSDPKSSSVLPWRDVFSLSQFAYEEGVWNGPLAVLVDQKTGSAAEEFASTLQQNRAAVIAGAPTAGAGCGYTAGGITTVLRNSRAQVLIPDCVRYNRDGADDNSGVEPDILIGFRPVESDQRRAQRTIRALDQMRDSAFQLTARPER